MGASYGLRLTIVNPTAGAIVCGACAISSSAVAFTLPSSDEIEEMNRVRLAAANVEVKLLRNAEDKGKRKLEEATSFRACA